MMMNEQQDRKTSDGGGGKTATIKSTSKQIYNWGITQLPSNTQISNVDFCIGVDEGKYIEEADQPIISRLISDTLDKFSNKDEKPIVNVIVDRHECHGIALIEYHISFNFDKECIFDTVKLAEIQCIHPNVCLTPMRMKFDSKSNTLQLVMTVSSMKNPMDIKHIRLLQHQITPLLFNNDDNEIGPNENNRFESIFRVKKRKLNTTPDMK